jgi:SAM-dependent methyltransferase
MSDLLNRVRRFELEAVRTLFPSHAVVAEVGGGNGFQASIIAGWGCRVHAFDIAGRPAGSRSYHPVTEYDGRHLPMPDESVDVVFSSNVLEHVVDLPALLVETRRVLKPGGVAIHILPTPAWRFWSIVAHYPFLVFAALGIRTGFVNWSDPNARHVRTSERGRAYLLRRILWPGPHGEFPSALAELAGFRAKRWVEMLEACGFVVERVQATRIYYSGYGLFRGLPTAMRRRMARCLGSSTQAIVARKPVWADLAKVRA